MHQSIATPDHCSGAMLATNKTKLRYPIPSAAAARSISQPPSRCSTPSLLRQQPSLARTHARDSTASTPPVYNNSNNNNNNTHNLLLDPWTMCLDDDHQVKLALTDLLNCADVKSDPEMRLWVQNRLMDVEQRLKRRRKSQIVHAA